MSDEKHEPPEAIELRFCPVCGRNDFIRELKPHHYQAGKLCSGKLIRVTYKRESKPVDSRQ